MCVCVIVEVCGRVVVYICVCDILPECCHSLFGGRLLYIYMGWLRLVGALKVQVSFAKEPYKRDDILQKRPIILRRLLIVATPYLLSVDLVLVVLAGAMCVCTHPHTHTQCLSRWLPNSHTPACTHHTYKYTLPHSHIPPQSHIHTYWHTPTHTHTNMHTRAHTHTHTNTSTHTHIHTHTSTT